MIEQRLRAIGREAKALGTGRKRRYPAALRARAISVAEEARGAGWAWAALAAAMDIGADMVQRWQQTAPRLASALMPIEILPVATFPIDVGIVVTTPTGFRVEGMALDQAAILVKALS